MLQDNPLLAQLKQQLRESLPVKEGVVRATTKNFGFLEVSDKESHFISPPLMKKLLNGDRISAVIREVDAKTQAEPETLLEAGLQNFVGRVKRFKNRLQIVPDLPLFKDGLKAKAVNGIDDKALADGDWVQATLVQHALKDEQFLVEVTALIAKATDPEAPWLVVLARHNLPTAAPLSEFSEQQATTPRSDLTAVPFFTIDSSSTQDMDDAIAITQTTTGWQLKVAVADPDAYIPAGSALDQIAAERLFTTYLPGRNIPMLPRQLADELCSLHQNQPRPALVLTLNIQQDGTIEPDYRFELATICSQARFDYTQVSDYLEGTGSWQPESSLMAEQLQQLSALAKARQQWRKTHAIVFPDKPDYRFDLNAGHQVVAIHAEQRRIANLMVEEAMIAANQSAGRYLASQPGFGLFNTHSGFDSSKLNPLNELLSKFDAPVLGDALTELSGFCQLRRWLDQLPSAYLDTRIRRFQAYATVSTTPAAHFGLGAEYYATWTSPIRKYSDLVNQRLIKATLLQTATEPPAAELAKRLAEQRKIQRRAERDIADWLYCQFLSTAQADGQCFTGEVQDINRTGVRLRLLENGAQGFLALSELGVPADSLSTNWEEGRCYQGDNIMLELGQQLQVQISEINPDSQTINLKLPAASADL
jgi:exoribonuclease-2